MAKGRPDKRSVRRQVQQDQDAEQNVKRNAERNATLILKECVLRCSYRAIVTLTNS
jgi:hypothetical protein